jgi:hypothetical protein
MHACVKRKQVHPTFISANIAATIQLRWLLVASRLVAVRPFEDGRYFVSWQLNENCAFLADCYVAGGTAATVARRNFPKQFLHFHRDGHGAITRPQIQRDYSAFVHTKVSRVTCSNGWTQAGRLLLLPGRGRLDAVEDWQIRRRVFRWRHRVFQDS